VSFFEDTFAIFVLVNNDKFFIILKTYYLTLILRSWYKSFRQTKLAEFYE